MRIRPDLAGRTWHDKLEVASCGGGDWVGGKIMAKSLKTWLTLLSPWLLDFHLEKGWFQGVGFFRPWKINWLVVSKIFYFHPENWRDHSGKQSVSLFQWRCLCCTAIMTSSWRMPGGEGGGITKNWNAVLLGLWMFSRVRKANKLRFSRYKTYETTNRRIYGSTHNVHKHIRLNME